ncbi:YcnI family protein [Oxalobacteraceae bacterium]|nr:YcnI family protein [Oxalobacteraceae bacterium]
MNKTFVSLAASTALAMLALAPAAQAHVTLEQRSAPAGAYQKLTFRVGHGCEGSATRSLSVLLPESVVGAKPMPKNGWKVIAVDGKLSVPVESHGKTISSAVREIRWTGGPLPDAHYDEFSMQVKLPEDAGKLYFKVVQQCVKGALAWDEMPGDSAVKLKSPAPVLDVVSEPAAAPAHQH